MGPLVFSSIFCFARGRPHVGGRNTRGWCDHREVLRAGLMDGRSAGRLRGGASVRRNRPVRSVVRCVRSAPGCRPPRPAPRRCQGDAHVRQAGFQVRRRSVQIPTRAVAPASSECPVSTTTAICAVGWLAAQPADHWKPSSLRPLEVVTSHIGVPASSAIDSACSSIGRFADGKATERNGGGIHAAGVQRSSARRAGLKQCSNPDVPGEAPHRLVWRRVYSRRRGTVKTAVDLRQKCRRSFAP